eukprot:1066598-Ditylum_brightwellii.AAC.1
MWQSSVAVALDQQGHRGPRTNSYISLAEDIYLTSKNDHNLSGNHNTTFKRHSEGSTNGNVHSENILSIGRETPHIAKEENLADFMRDHPPPIQ